MPSRSREELGRAVEKVVAARHLEHRVEGLKLAEKAKRGELTNAIINASFEIEVTEDYMRIGETLYNQGRADALLEAVNLACEYCASKAWQLTPDGKLHFNQFKFSPVACTAWRIRKAIEQEREKPRTELEEADKE